MRIVEMQTESGRFRKIGAWRGKQQCYDAILKNAQDEGGIYRITTYAAGHAVATRLVQSMTLKRPTTVQRITKLISSNRKRLPRDLKAKTKPWIAHWHDDLKAASSSFNLP